MNETSEPPSDLKASVHDGENAARSTSPNSLPHVVIVGGGFGGLQAVKGLRRVPVNVTLIDRRNHHLFQPLLYQVATGALSPANIAVPFRALFKRYQRTRIVMAEVVDIHVSPQGVELDDGQWLPFDWLILATGSTHSYFGHTEWEHFAPGLKSLEDATQIRQRILSAFEMAERLGIEDARGSAESITPWLRFVVVGGGPTGVELAGQLAEIAYHTLVRDYRAIDPKSASVYLIEAADRILSAYSTDLAEQALKSLEQLGVTVLTGARVTAIQEQGIDYEDAEGHQHLEVRTVLWAAGVQASRLSKKVAQQTQVALDRTGRVPVNPKMTIPGYPNIFVIGDLARVERSGQPPLPAVAPVATQQGAYVARSIRARLRGESVGEFAYRDRGSLATIGRYRAVGNIFGWHVSGAFAWWLWLFIHLMALVRFENRMLVFIQWAWHFFTRNRSARLITNSEASSADERRPG